MHIGTTCPFGRRTDHLLGAELRGSGLLRGKATGQQTHGQAFAHTHLHLHIHQVPSLAGQQLLQGGLETIGLKKGQIGAWRDDPEAFRLPLLTHAGEIEIACVRLPDRSFWHRGLHGRAAVFALPPRLKPESLPASLPVL